MCSEKKKKQELKEIKDKVGMQVAILSREACETLIEKVTF
jgi:hypothetical protein